MNNVHELQHALDELASKPGGLSENDYLRLSQYTMSISETMRKINEKAAMRVFVEMVMENAMISPSHHNPLVEIISPSVIFRVFEEAKQRRKPRDFFVIMIQSYLSYILQTLHPTPVTMASIAIIVNHASQWNISANSIVNDWAMGTENCLVCYFDDAHVEDWGSERVFEDHLLSYTESICTALPMVVVSICKCRRCNKKIKTCARRFAHVATMYWDEKRSFCMKNPDYERLFGPRTRSKSD